MTTTFNLNKNPDYYFSKDDCKKGGRTENSRLNERYDKFKQTHFTAGDVDQFQQYRDRSNGRPDDYISIEKNVFNDVGVLESIKWAKYKNLNAESVDNTFNYMFHKFKKGTFIKIQNNELKVFLPFSKSNFINEWGNRIKINPLYNGIYNFQKYINKLANKTFKIKVDNDTSNWYANNCLVRYEDPINEGDTNVANMSDMLKQLCANKKVPDVEFFVNRRDFPIITRNSTEAYDHLFGDDHPLLSHNYKQYSPILSMVTTDKYADIPIPTGHDWARISSYEGKFFMPNCNAYPTIEDFNVEWKDKKPTAVFRGSSTGCGVTIESNPRLKLAYLSVTTPPDEHGPLLDAGISKWQLRPRKLKTEKYLQTIDVPSMTKLGIKLVGFLSPVEQSAYKYLVNVDGHVSAFRLSLEMSMGCCILLVDSKYKIWFRDMMKPMVHYVPVKSDLSDLIDQIKWCRSNDSTCKDIANNALAFYNTYLQKDGMLDYLQKIMIDIKKQSGVYLYNTVTPLQYQLMLEETLDISYPLTSKTIKDIKTMPPKQARSFGLLKGLQWIINMINDKSVFEDIATLETTIFKNKNNKVLKYTLAAFTFAFKSTTDSQKRMENVHEAYIGTNSINEIVKYIPNFAYIFGKSKDSVIMEYISGTTLDDWIRKSDFNMVDFLFIFIQIAFALEVAQRQSGFVHWDLTPWNIIIQKKQADKISFDYIIDEKNVFRVKTQLIPVIIDYGKSHVIYDNKHHGFINMFKLSTIQDIISLLLTSLSSIIQLKNITNNDVNDIIKLANFLHLPELSSGGGYKQTPFKSLSDVKYFINRAKKYSELISSNKYELESKTPLDFINYIKNEFKYTFSYEKIIYPEFRINKGNPTQVFNYILAVNDIERIKSFSDIFDKVVECDDLLLCNNLFFSYYIAQSLEYNISCLYTLMERYLTTIKVSEVLKEQVKQKYTAAVEKITKYFNIERQLEPIVYDVKSTTKAFKLTEDIFLRPDVVLNLLNTIPDNYKVQSDAIKLADYKLMIEIMLLNKGVFRLTDNHTKYYIDIFRDLLDSDIVTINTNIANNLTLYATSKYIYSNDRAKLVGLIQSSKYISYYDNINDFFYKK